MTIRQKMMLVTTVFSRALIVDDDPVCADILAQLLRYMGIQSDIASDGETAIRMTEQTLYQFAVVDLLLPKMDGWELLKHLRANTINESMLVFSLTAYYDPVLAAKAHHAGFDACYPKPATPGIIHDMQAILNETNRPPGSRWGWEIYSEY